MQLHPLTVKLAELERELMKKAGFVVGAGEGGAVLTETDFLGASVSLRSFGFDDALISVSGRILATHIHDQWIRFVIMKNGEDQGTGWLDYHLGRGSLRYLQTDFERYTDREGVPVDQDVLQVAFHFPKFKHWDGEELSLYFFFR
jgi:hypothetical protein